MSHIQYSRNKNINGVESVKLTVPNQGIRVDKEKYEICIPSLKLTLSYSSKNDFEKINQIEIGHRYAHISVSVPDKPMIEP